MSKRRSSQMLMRRSRRAVSVSVDWDNIIKSGWKVNEVRQLLQEVSRPRTNFCTGSHYTGTWNAISMAGYGTYHLPYGVSYEGEMYDGMFHGEGTLTYTMFNQKMKGIWDKGKLITFQYEYNDGLTYSQPWHYCQHPDRRFAMEMGDDLKPAGMENLTNYQPTRKIDKGCYDVGDGFYNPKNKCVTLPEDSRVILRREGEEEEEISDDPRFWFNRVSTKHEHKWIIKHCRKEWDEATGYRPDLYEAWFTGRKQELEGVDASEFSDFSEMTEMTEISTDNQDLEYFESYDDDD